MCGIAGSVDQSGRGADHLAAQLATVEHRGPDATGTFVRGAIAIGQTRLAVIDLLTGNPPVTDEAGTVGAVLNGEIYNYRPLREQLLDAGHLLRTEGDTEVIAHLAEELEPVELARHLDGMFAFAVSDVRRHRLILGRDRLGKKPLYYWERPGVLVFGSEIKAVLSHPLVPRRPNLDVLPSYLALGYVPTPGTFYEGIQSLPPGHVLVRDPGCEAKITRYWEPPGPGGPPLSCSLDEGGVLVRNGLRAAVGRRLVADVPLGAFLSGGVDSSAVVACMTELMDRPVASFTIGFEDDDGFDERPYARLVAEQLGTEHTEFVVRPRAADLLERLVEHHDQPFGDSSALPTYLLSELTRKDVTVALCGDGGDELFAGYRRFAAAAALERYRLVPLLIRQSISRAAGVLPPRLFAGRVGSLQRLLAHADQPTQRALLAWVSYVPAPLRQALLAESPLEDASALSYDQVWNETTGHGPIDRLLLLNLRTYLLDDLLPKVDRMAMAHGLEVRSPFLDTELVQLAFRLPEQVKLRGTSGKRVLKRAFRDVLPRDILRRPKRGFGLPLDRWFREDLRSLVEARLTSPEAAVRAHLKPAEVDRLVSEHQSGSANHGHALWTLLTLEIFLRKEGW